MPSATTPTHPPFVNPTNFPAARFGDFGTLLNVIVPNLIFVAGLIFTILIIYGGYQYMRSDGNPENLKKARNVFLYAVIGFGIVLGSYIAIKLVATIFDLGDLPF